MIETPQRHYETKIYHYLATLYGDKVEDLYDRIFDKIKNEVSTGLKIDPERKWDEKDTILITYGDIIRQESESPLLTLKEFCDNHLKGLINTIHILPFFPYSSDDGFSIIDYKIVDPKLGTWQDIEAIRKNYFLMIDLVLNHCSSKHSWFRQFLANQTPGKNYFITFPEKVDTSSIVRPRSTPVLTKYGKDYLWTTFSEDQIDLNWENSHVFFEFLDIIFLYISKGARFIRLDAIAYLWKKLGTPSIHLKEVHTVIKLLHEILSLVFPSVLIITETNVPHEENISYFGKGDEANIVYNFSLPPLILHALLSNNATYLTTWADQLKPPPKGCTFLNFTASHDGIGVRPLKDLVPDKEFNFLIDTIAKKGGAVSKKRNRDGTESPYELNITYRDALDDNSNVKLGIERFLCSQAIMLSFRGIPAVYFHSLVGTHNDYKGVEHTGRSRSINRHKWGKDELYSLISNKESDNAIILNKYKTLLNIKSARSEFHPNAQQIIHNLGPDFFVIERTNKQTNNKLFGIFNVTDKEQQINLSSLCAFEAPYDLISDNLLTQELPLNPYQYSWIIETKQ